MDINTEEQKREEFRRILFELAESRVDLKAKRDRSAMYQRLENLYYIPNDTNKYFRHFYSDIFQVVAQIHQKDKPGDISTLGLNIDQIHKGYRPLNKCKSTNETIDITDCLKKLYDHVSLDIARIDYTIATNRKYSGEEDIIELRSKTAAMQLESQKLANQLKESQSQLETVEKKLDSSQKEYISILGIFSSVVLVFTAGVAFSTSVLENIAESSIYRTVFITLLIGLVLIDAISLLFYHVEKLVHNKNKYNIMPIIIINVVILLLMGVNLLAWRFGAVEHRNVKLSDQYQSSATETTSTKTEDTFAVPSVSFCLYILHIHPPGNIFTDGLFTDLIRAVGDAQSAVYNIAVINIVIAAYLFGGFFCAA